MAEPVRPARLAHLRGEEMDFEVDRQARPSLVGLVPQIIERPGVALGPGRLGDAIGGERLGGDHPGRNGRVEILGEEGAERLIFPRLGNRAADQSLRGRSRRHDRPPRRRDRITEIIAPADPDPQLQL